MGCLESSYEPIKNATMECKLVVENEFDSYTTLSAFRDGDNGSDEVVYIQSRLRLYDNHLDRDTILDYVREEKYCNVVWTSTGSVKVIVIVFETVLTKRIVIKNIMRSAYKPPNLLKVICDDGTAMHAYKELGLEVGYSYTVDYEYNCNNKLITKARDKCLVS